VVEGPLAHGCDLTIISAAAGYSQLLAFSGASRGLVATASQLALPALGVIALLLLITVAMGTFMDPIALMMITIPLFVPVVTDLGFSPVWFGIMFLLCLDIGGLTPPVGLLLFVMKGVVPPDITMGQIVASVWPFVFRELGLVALVLFFPQLVLWLPSLAL
jgi:TRAP-type C4-dicarboxylate transport system permease large subunit